MDKIECPKCHHKFELTDSLAGPLVAAARAEVEAAATTRIAAMVKTAEAQALVKAKEFTVNELALVTKLHADAKELLAAKDKKLGEAQAAQAKFEAATRVLDDEKRELALNVERQVAAGAETIRIKAQADAEALMGGRVAEYELKVAGLSKTAEELRHKLEQGSQQSQGEVQELALESSLSAAFPADTIEPVAKGVGGADALQRVSGGGTILWESKRTKVWSDGWLSKLRDDQRAAKADVAVIVTTAMPKSVATFGLIEGVWVCSVACAVPLAAALRFALVEAAAARTSLVGVQSKSEEVYSYLIGPRFKHRVEAIVEAFSSMQEDLDRERKAVTKMWEKRAGQIERVMQSTVGMYGDLQSIAGKSLTEISGLDLAQLEDKSS